MQNGLCVMGWGHKEYQRHQIGVPVPWINLDEKWSWPELNSVNGHVQDWVNLRKKQTDK